jgi:hypothetical protein
MNQGVRAAIGAVIEDAGAKKLALRMGVNPSTVYYWAENKPMPVERFEQLHHASGDLRPIIALCHALGGVFHPVPSGKCEVQQEMLIAIREFAQLIDEVSASLLDGHIDTEEKRRILRRGAPFLRTVAVLLGAVQEMGD